jgi:GT2 family glycosyltransferase
MPSRLSVAIVTYRTDAPVLARCLRSLARSVALARARGLVDRVELYLIDNGPPVEAPSAAPALEAWPREAGTAHVRTGQGNIGYGQANNLVLEELSSDFHVAMNPDVEIDPEAIPEILAAFRNRPDVGLIAPSVVDACGAPQYLCKRYPSLWVLFLRGFAPRFLRRRFAASIERYEMRDVIGEHAVAEIPLASGCFMAFRTALFRKVDGFDARYFMYFEDFDLSLRLGGCARLAYVPQARIVHHGGGASSKGPRHVFWFVRSALRFFSRHGWKIA